MQIAQATDPLRALDPVAANAQYYSPVTSNTGNVQASLHFENNRALDGVASTNVAVHSADAYESCQTIGNTSIRARTSAHHLRAKSYSARVPTQYNKTVRQTAALPLTAMPSSCLNCGATDHLVRACLMNLKCSVVC